ncbi:MAG: VanZ family protein [Candidatus Izemoplasmatales bacterium]
MPKKITPKNIYNYNKYISLSISIIITLFIFSMSLVPGTESGNISSSFSVSIKTLLDSVFINNNINLDTLHIVLRKGAHVFEYFVLGISYFFTAKYWKLSILKVLIIGLLTATADELLQNIPIDRAASAIDIFVYDFGGFILGLGLLLLFLNKTSKLNEKQVLDLLAKKEISSKKAYKILYNNNEVIRFTNNAHFVRLRIVIPEEKGVNTFLGILFFLPFPIFIIKLILPFIKTETMNIPLTKSEIIKIITSKGINLVVNTSTNEKIIIKTI